MLVLSRKKDEMIVLRIGDVRVEIKIKDARTDKAQIGFTAPPEVVIYRKELEQFPRFGGGVPKSV